MTEKPRGRFEATWDELETAVHVPFEDQVETHDVSATGPVPNAAELDEMRAFGMAGGVPVQR